MDPGSDINSRREYLHAQFEGYLKDEDDPDTRQAIMSLKEIALQLLDLEELQMYNILRGGNEGGN